MSRPWPRYARATTFLGLAILSGLSQPSPSPAGEHTTIPWRTDLERARSEAQARGLPLWVHFTGSWCPSCRQMEMTTFPDSRVIASATERFIPVLVQSDDREDLVVRYGITGIPAALILTPADEVVAKNEGYADPASFLGFLEEARGRYRPRPSLALAGNCPVAFVRAGELRPGRPELATEYDGRLFRFADAESREAFLREPERYLPGNGGRCVVRQVDRGESVPGDPRFGVYYRDRLYLCSDAESRARFARDPRRYADADLALDGYCPHCREDAGRLVRGRTTYPSTHHGRRYLFPDETHRQAFRSSPERFLR